MPLSRVPVHDRPRERLAAHGAGVLADRELLALLLGTGGANGVGVHELAERIVDRFGSIESIDRATVAELTEVKAWTHDSGVSGTESPGRDILRGGNPEGGIMATCEVCGNDYWMAFQVRTASGDTHTFDSFECAVHKLAPVCEHCGCKIIGHGVEVSGRFFCCAHCARSVDKEQGSQLRDTVGAHPG